MFEFFKGKAAPQKQTPTFSRKMQGTNALVQEIHNAFEGAADADLLQARAVIASTRVDENAERKNALGFTHAKGVVEHKERMKQKQLSEEMQALVLYHQQAYPHYKFITEDHVKTICEKYGLVFGDSSDYKGDIPEKNIAEIERFKAFMPRIKPEDHSYIHHDREIEMMEWRMNFMRLDLDMGPRNSNARRKISFQQYQGLSDCPPTFTHSFYREDGFRICAPLKDMNTEGKMLVGHRLVDIPDPVVLFPVRDGYLIVSKWGLEGEDPSLVNESMN